MTSPWSNAPDIPADEPKTEQTEPDYAVVVNPLDFDRVYAHLGRRAIAAGTKCGCGSADCGFRAEGEILQRALPPSPEVSQGYVRMFTQLDGPFTEGTLQQVFESLDNPALFDAEVEDHMRTLVLLSKMGF